MTRTNTDPLRRVTAAAWFEGSAGLGSQRFTIRWWELTLECGHRTERPARAKAGITGPRGFARMHHPIPSTEENYRPAPARARCHDCGRVTTPR